MNSTGNPLKADDKMDLVPASPLLEGSPAKQQPIKADKKVTTLDEKMDN